MQKRRASGTHQEGHIHGARVILQRLQSDRIYLSAEYLRASGNMLGKDHKDRPLVSELTDEIVEGHVGYCFQTKGTFLSIFTPFIGYGHFQEENNFITPSILQFTSVDKFDYTVAGFLSAIVLKPSLECGFNFKTFFMNNAISTIHDPDPEFGDIDLMIREVPFLRIEFPWTFYLDSNRPLLYLRLTPFYEYRHFGGKEGVPFNFHDTQFNLFGLTTTLIFTY